MVLQKFILAPSDVPSCLSFYLTWYLDHCWDCCSRSCWWIFHLSSYCESSCTLRCSVQPFHHCCSFSFWISGWPNTWTGAWNTPGYTATSPCSAFALFGSFVLLPPPFWVTHVAVFEGIKNSFISLVLQYFMCINMMDAESLMYKCFK